MYCNWILTPEAQISLRFARRPAVFKIQGRKSEIHQMTPEWPYALNCQKGPVYTEYSPPRPKFHSVSLYDQPYSRYKVENRKCTKWPENNLTHLKSECTEWPQNYLNHLSVKSTLYTLNTHTRGPNFTPFRSTISRFRDTRLSKIGMHRMTPELPYQGYHRTGKTGKTGKMVKKIPCREKSGNLKFWRKSGKNQGIFGQKYWW